MKILHPTDFSAAAEKARLLALDISERLGASLHVAHVQETFDAVSSNPLVRSYLSTVSPEVLQNLREEDTLEVQRLHDRLKQLTPIGGSYELIWGEVVPELLKILPDYDLVVMGAHGANRFDEVFMGGVAGRLVRRTPVPILSVREEATARHLERILVATDFGLASARALGFCKQLSASGVELAVCHVSDRRDSESTQEMVAKLGSFAAGIDARHILCEGNPVRVLPKVAWEIGANAIAIGVRQHPQAVGLLLGSRADALLRSSPVPILSVPNRAA